MQTERIDEGDPSVTDASASTAYDREDQQARAEPIDIDEPRHSPWIDDARFAAERAREWVADNPFAALGVAVATGFVLGRILRR